MLVLYGGVDDDSANLVKVQDLKETRQMHVMKSFLCGTAADNPADETFPLSAQAASTGAQAGAARAVLLLRERTTDTAGRAWAQAQGGVPSSAAGSQRGISLQGSKRHTGERRR